MGSSESVVGNGLSYPDFGRGFRSGLCFEVAEANL